MNNREGVALLKEAAVAGEGRASKKLMEIYANGGMGVGKDYNESVNWKKLAIKQKQDVNE